MTREQFVELGLTPVGFELYDEFIKDGDLVYNTVKEASELLKLQYNINEANAIDSIYKAFKRKSKKTRDYIVLKLDGKVVLRKLEQNKLL